MPQTLGYQYAHLLRQFFKVADGEKLEAIDFLSLVEGGDVSFEQAERSGVLELDALPDLVHDYFISKIRAGEMFFGIQFLIPVTLLERLAVWNAWETMRLFLEKENVEPLLVFKNTRLQRDGMEVVPAELRMFPTVDILA